MFTVVLHRRLTVAEKLQEKGYEIRCESHAAAILERDFPEALKGIERGSVG